MPDNLDFLRGGEKRAFVNTEKQKYSVMFKILNINELLASKFLK